MGTGGGYEGTIVVDSGFEAVNGRLIIKLTKYSSATGKVGNYTALYWHDLTAESVRFADFWVPEADKPNDAGYSPPPYEEGGNVFTHVMFASTDLAAAKGYFTEAKVSEIDWSATSTYEKQ